MAVYFIKCLRIEQKNERRVWYPVNVNRHGQPKKKKKIEMRYIKFILKIL